LEGEGSNSLGSSSKARNDANEPDKSVEADLREQIRILQARNGYLEKRNQELVTDKADAQDAIDSSRLDPMSRLRKLLGELDIDQLKEAHSVIWEMREAMLTSRKKEKVAEGVTEPSTPATAQTTRTPQTPLTIRSKRTGNVFQSTPLAGSRRPASTEPRSRSPTDVAAMNQRFRRQMNAQARELERTRGGSGRSGGVGEGEIDEEVEDGDLFGD
jgi:hypothetical protein